MKFILLPGMDGTGLLYKPLLTELPKQTNIEVITYSTTEKQTYDELREEIKLKLPVVPFVLIAESFSGPIAHQLSLDPNIPIEKVILIASFVSTPYPRLKKIARYFPINWLLKIPIPKFIINYYCFGNLSSAKLVKLFRETIELVNNDVLAFRINEILSCKTAMRVSNIQCIQLSAKGDRLIPNTCSRIIPRFFKNIVSIEIDGPHFLAQTNTTKIISILEGEN